MSYFKWKLATKLFVTLAMANWMSVASATLINDSINIQYAFGVTNNILEQDTVVVSPGTEVTCSAIGTGTSSLCNLDFGGDYLASLDIGAHSISITWSSRGAFFDPPGGFNGFIFAGLDWSGSPGSISSVSAVCNDLSGGSCNTQLSFGNNDPLLGNFVSVNFAGCTPLGNTPGSGGLNGPSCNPTDFQLLINPVSEPASLALLSLALVGIGFSRRKPK